MIYDNFYQNREIKVPVWFSVLVLLLIIIFFNFFLSSNYLKISSRATIYPIRQIKITNITNNQASIFWETSEKEKSYLIFGENENQLNKIYFDDREVSSDRSKRNFHIVLLNNLESEKKYYFKIITEKGVYGDLEGKPFSFKTFSSNTKIFLSPPIYGKVINFQNHGLPNAMVFFYKNNELLAVTYTKEKGDWLVILKRANQSFNRNEILKIEIYSENKKKSVIEGKINQLSPVKETVIIGKNYSFLTEGQILSIGGTRLDPRYDFDIFYPKDKAIVSGFKPLIKGSGLPDSEVNVIIKSNTIYSFKTKVDQKGDWLINLPINLNPGQYQLEAIGQGVNRKITKIRQFTIAKSGEQVLGEATPSATIIPPTITPTMVTPTLFFTPTSIPTIYKSGTISSFSYLILSLTFFFLGGFLIIAR